MTQTETQPGAHGATPPLILVVEDEEAVRCVVERALIHQGYRVLTAADPEEALKRFAGLDEELGLLLTDIVLPKFYGPQLYERLQDLQPGLRVLYMSGYPDMGRGEGRTRDPGAPFMYKPFTVVQLQEEVASALAAPPPRRTPSPDRVEVEVRIS